ncbi:PITX2 [Branchiostoma lanceolatum]|uniref:PITX2 protein n=1 Tax=Branchiostoma lanceolatum TaxID=7740 RepID=A0A8J9VI10_BRALA|nr:PITX2 [Branchiostoma lanceolatum]
MMRSSGSPTSSDDFASRTKSAISTLADLCTALRDVEPQVVNEVLPQRYHHLVPSTSAPTVAQEVAVSDSKVSSEHPAAVGTEPTTLPSPAAVDSQVPSPKRIFIPGKTTIRPMPDYCRVIFHPSSPDMDNRKRRARTVFSAQQLKRLEEEYKKCSYPDKERRQSVADATGLTEGCVRIWYQNRRAKDHRLKDSEKQREGMSVSSTSHPEMPGILSSRPVEPARLPPSEMAPSTTLNRAEEAAMEALVNLSSTASTETIAAHNPQNNLNSAAQSDEAMSDVDTKSSATESIPPCKNIGAASKSDRAEQRTVSYLQLALEKTEQLQIRQTEEITCKSKLIPMADPSAVDKPSDDTRTAPSEQVEKASRVSSQPKSQRAIIASLVAQTLKRSEGLDHRRTVVPIAVVNIPIVRVEDTQANPKQSASSSNPTMQDEKPSTKRSGVDTEKAKLSSYDIPSTIVLRLQPRPMTVTSKSCTSSGESRKDSEKETDQPTSNIDDFNSRSSSTPGVTDRKRKVCEEESVNKGCKVVQTKMWRELKEEKSVAKRTKNMTKGSKKSSPSQMIQPSIEGKQCGEGASDKDIPTKETTKGSSAHVESTQTKLLTADTKSLTNACTVMSDGNTQNPKNSHPTTLHYKKGRVCQCHQLQEIIDYCVRKGPETAAKTDNVCSTPKGAGSLQRPREGKGQGEPPRQVPKSGDSVPKTWAPGTVRHLKITAPISIATSSSLTNVRSFGAVPIGSVRASRITNVTQHGGSFHRPTPASFRHVHFSKKPCPIPAAVIPKSSPATGQLFLNKNKKAAVQLKATRGVRVVVSHPSNNVTLPTAPPVCEAYTTPPTFTRPTVSAVAQRAHHTCGAAAMFRLGSVFKRPNASSFRLPLVMNPAERIATVVTTGYTSSGIRLQPVQNRGQPTGQPGGVNRQPPLPQGDGNALRRLQRFTDVFMERHRSSAPSTESRRDDRPPPPKVRRTDM